MTNRKEFRQRRFDGKEAWRLLQQRKCHLEKGLSSALPPSVYRSLKSLWEPVQTFVKMLSPLPAPLVELWARVPNGHLLFSARPSAYEPNAVTVGDRMFVAVATIGIQQLIDAEIAPLIATGRLIDHLLGSYCEPGKPNLTDGSSVLGPEVSKLGLEIQELWRLGYGPDWTENSPADYFAWGFAEFIRDRKRLNVVDPLLEKLFRHKLFSAQFWGAVQRK